MKREPLIASTFESKGHRYLRLENGKQIDWYSAVGDCWLPCSSKGCKELEEEYWEDIPKEEVHIELSNADRNMLNRICDVLAKDKENENRGSGTG